MGIMSEESDIDVDVAVDMAMVIVPVDDIVIVPVDDIAIVDVIVAVLGGGWGGIEEIEKMPLKKNDELSRVFRTVGECW